MIDAKQGNARWEEWLEEQLDYRLGAVRGAQYILNSKSYQACSKVPRMAVLDSASRRFSGVNGFSQRCFFDEVSQRYEYLPGRGRALRNRPVLFANMILESSCSGHFVMNWCDAAGVDYLDSSVGINVPVLQFVRRRFQRDQVVLFPVDPVYSGIGGANLPLSLPDRPFSEKKDAVVWRGRYCGTAVGSTPRNWLWAEEVFSGAFSFDDPIVMAQLRSMPRWTICAELAEVGWANVGLTLTQQERAACDASSALGSLILPHTKPKLNLAAQLAYKYILVVPGNDIGSGLYWALMSNSVVLKVETEWETALEAGLEPWVHYVPVEPTLSSIESAITRLARDQHLCEAIISNAQSKMRPHLNSEWRLRVDMATIESYGKAVKSDATVTF